MNKLLFTLFFALFVSGIYAQDAEPMHSEYLVVRVQYGANTAGLRYDLYLDIGVSGAHSMSGRVTNIKDVVTITDENGKHEFKNDMDLVNYLAKEGWLIINFGEVDILDQHYTTYVMERKY